MAAAARLVANPEQLTYYATGDYTERPAVLTGYTLAELGVLRDGWAELPPRPPILVFAYSQSGVVEALPSRANVLVVPSPAYDEASFIPGDGHPNARGNAGFARMIAAAMRGDARFAALFP